MEYSGKRENSAMPHVFKLEQFEGPLDLLLRMIEEEKMDVTQVALSKVTEQFIQYLIGLEEKQPEELADFLVVASKLLLIKSRVLLPQVVLEEDGSDLEKQLRIYKEYLEATKILHKIILTKPFEYVKEDYPPMSEKVFVPPNNFGPEDMRLMFAEIIKKIEPYVKLPEETLRKIISTREKYQYIQNLIFNKASLKFRELLEDAQSKSEVVATFLALLELVKQRHVVVKQGELFDEIVIERSEEQSIQS